MKKIFFLFSFFFFLFSLNAQTTINGILDSTISMMVNNGDFSYGIEEYANIRFQSRLRDNRAVVYGAVNLIAAAGNSGLGLVGRFNDYDTFQFDHTKDNTVHEFSVPKNYYSTAFFAGENYIAGIELERLYFRLNFEKANFDAGLFRLPFGYSQVWGSSDFLNPKNPLKPDARPRGVLGMALAVFPAGDLKIGTFAVAPRNPFLNDGSGVLAGISFENHWRRLSAQALYSYETPKEGTLFTPSSKYGIHRAGLSLKMDIEASLIFDALYIYNHEAETKWDGLSFNIGADYSFIDGKLLVMAEYLYNGENSSTAQSPVNPLGMPERDNIYSGLTWLINDFTNITAAVIVCLNDASSTPILSFNHDLFQGATLTITAQYPIEEKIVACSARLRLRF